MVIILLLNTSSDLRKFTIYFFNFSIPFGSHVYILLWDCIVYIFSSILSFCPYFLKHFYNCCLIGFAIYLQHICHLSDSICWLSFFPCKLRFSWFFIYQVNLACIQDIWYYVLRLWVLFKSHKKCLFLGHMGGSVS